MRQRHPVPMEHLVSHHNRQIVQHKNQQRPAHIHQHSRQLPPARNDHAPTSAVTGRNTRPPSSETLPPPFPMPSPPPKTVGPPGAIAPAPEGCVRRCCNCSSTFPSVRRRFNSLGVSSGPASDCATLSAACAFFSQLFTVGI